MTEEDYEGGEGGVEDCPFFVRWLVMYIVLLLLRFSRGVQLTNACTST